MDVTEKDDPRKIKKKRKSRPGKKRPELLKAAKVENKMARGKQS